MFRIQTFTTSHYLVDGTVMALLDAHFTPGVPALSSCLAFMKMGSVSIWNPTDSHHQNSPFHRQFL